MGVVMFDINNTVVRYGVDSQRCLAFVHAQTPQPPPIAEFAAGKLSAENPPEKLRRVELAAEFC